jgi:hypothetical protein
MDDFMNKMGLGDPDPSNYQKKFTGFFGGLQSRHEIVLMIGSNKINLMIGVTT